MRSRSASLLITAVTLLTPVVVNAQRGQGGTAGGGFHGGVYHGSASVARPATPNLGGRPYGIRTDIPTPIGLNPPAASYTGILPGAFKPEFNIGGRHNRGGGGALIGAPLYYPYLGSDTSLNTFPSYSETIDPNAQAFAAAQESLGEQIRQLTAELDSVKRQVNGPPPVAAPGMPETPAVSSPTPRATDATSQPPLAVVLKNGQSLSVQSYAVMNGFFWDFSKQPVRKIPLSSIDVPASVKASEANGTEFPDLSSSGSR
ncbi:MAG: hypothetical protein ACJ746_08895 [Bryobacteraceae bacterium]